MWFPGPSSLVLWVRQSESGPADRLLITDPPRRVASLLKLWPQKQQSTQGGGQHPEEGEQGSCGQRLKKEKAGEEKPTYQSRHGLTSRILHNHPKDCIHFM